MGDDVRKVFIFEKWKAFPSCLGQKRSGKPCRPYTRGNWIQRQSNKTTRNLLNTFDVGGSSHVDGNLTFILIFFNARLCQHEPKKLSRLYLKGTLGEIHAFVVLSD